MQRLDRCQRRRERLEARDIDRAGVEQTDHAFELVEILRHQRIGRRDRGCGHADMHGREREQRVIDTAVGENDHGVLGAQTLRQNPGGSRAHLPQRVVVGDGRPRRVDIRTFTEKNPLGRLPRPALQPVADATRVLLQRRGRFQPDTAVGAPIGHDLRRREQRFGIVATIGGCVSHWFPRMPSWTWGCRCSTREPRAPAMRHRASTAGQAGSTDEIPSPG